MGIMVNEVNMVSDSTIENGSPEKKEESNVILDVAYKQELKRQLILWDVATFVYSEAGAWVAALNTLTVPFNNGGFSSLIYGVIGLIPVIFCFVGCLSELVSTYPTAGGQYHFVALLAPKRYARLLSFVCGYISLFFWIASTTSCFLSLSQQLFQIVAYYQPRVNDYSRWTQVAVAWGFIIYSFLSATFHVRIVTLGTQFGMIFTLGLFIALNVTLLVMTRDKNPAELVFTTVTKNSGWENTPWSWIIGSSYVFYCFSALDAGLHLVEDMQTPRKDAPRANFIGAAINSFCLVFTVVVLCFCTTDLSGAIQLAPNFPLIAILDRSTRNAGAAVFLCSVCFVTLIIVGPGCILVSSRIIYALARDNSMPFHQRFSKVNSRFQTPVSASILASVITALICLIYVGNTTAFFAIVNTTSIFAILSFMMPIVVVIFVGRDKIAVRHYDMGRFGIACYWIASVVGSFYVIVLCFPFYIPATAENMNYASVVLAGALIVIALIWFFYAKYHFTGPLIELHGDGETPQHAIPCGTTASENKESEM